MEKMENLFLRYYILYYIMCYRRGNCRTKTSPCDTLLLNDPKNTCSLRAISSFLSPSLALASPHSRLFVRDFMDRRVTPPKRATSPTWGPPPPCKQALRHLYCGH